MPKRAAELTQTQINKLKPKHENRPTFYPVGGVSGLHWQVTPGGSGSWAIRVTIGGRRRWVGLGAYPEVRLGDARDRAREIKAQIAQGVDPLAERQAAKAALKREAGMTFAQAVEEYLSAKLDEFGNDKHRKQWRATLDTYATPIIGKALVKDLTVQDVLAVLSPIWTAKTETASRLRGRVENVLAWATVHGYREGDNPARWRGNLDAIMPKPSKVAKAAHWPALALSDAPNWFKTLRKRDGMAAQALAFLTLCASRSGEVRGMTWDEVDFEAGVWTVPAERMKAGKEHRVPLTEAAVALLRVLPRVDGSPYVFPAPRGGMLSDMTLSAVMRRMQETEEKAGRKGFLDAKSGRPAVPHGLRSTFRDWAAEVGEDRDLTEMALAHTVGSEVERAYRRTDLFEKRRELLERWQAAIGA